MTQQEEGLALSDLSDRDSLVTYTLGADETIEDGLLAAFDAVGFDLSTSEPPLVEFLNSDALGRMQWDNRHLRVVTRAWEHPVLITADEITIFASARRP